MDGKDNKEDKIREKADMTLSPVFPKSSEVVQKCPRVVQIHISSVFDRYPSYGSLSDRFGKNGLRVVMSLPGLVLLVVLAVHSALSCHSVVRTASNTY